MTQLAAGSFAKVLLVPFGGLLQRLVGFGVQVIEQRQEEVAVAVGQYGDVVLLYDAPRLWVSVETANSLTDCPR